MSKKHPIENREEYYLALVPCNGGNEVVLDIVTTDGDSYYCIGSDEPHNKTELEILIGPLSINEIAEKLAKEK